MFVARTHTADVFYGLIGVTWQLGALKRSSVQRPNVLRAFAGPSCKTKSSAMKFRGSEQKRTKGIVEKLSEYSARQKAFWNVADEGVAKFERVYFEDGPSWSDPAEREARWNASADQAVELVLAGIEPKPAWAILEIGCGVGRLIAKVRERAAFERFVGIDISESMINFAADGLGHDPRIQLSVNNGYSLPMILESSIDFAYSVDVFTHIFDVDLTLAYLKEVYRVLKDRGYFRFNVRRFDPDSAFGNSLGGASQGLCTNWEYARVAGIGGLRRSQRSSMGMPIPGVTSRNLSQPVV